MAKKLVIRAVFDARQLRDVREMLDAKTYQRLMVSSLNEAGRRGRALVSREIGKELSMTAADIKRTIDVTKSGLDVGDNPTVKVKVTREKMSMKRFAPRQTARGTTVKVRKREGRQLLKSAFVSEQIGGHVFKRKGRSRLPIQKKFGPTVAGVLGNKPGMADSIADEMASLAQTRFASKLELHLASKAKKK